MLNHTPHQESDLPRLRARFASALQRAGAAAEGRDLFEQIITHYGEPHRHYHTLTHVDACLAWLDWLTGAAEQPQEVELALWFHDLVYDPKRSDNEQRCAVIAGRSLRALGVSDAAVERITRHILATAKHTTAEGDTALLIDIDLSILGATQVDFDRFEQWIRSEYLHFPEAEYRAGRTRVLESFLSRPRLYTTPAVADLLEASARANLERTVHALSAGSGA